MWRERDKHMRREMLCVREINMMRREMLFVRERCGDER